MPVQYVKGVGPKMAEKLALLEIRTIEDLLHHYPRAWEDRRCRKKIREARVGEAAALFGEIQSFDFIETRRGFAIAKVELKDETGRIPLKWLRKKSFKYDVLQSFRKEFKEGASMVAYGKIDLDMDGKSMAVEEYEIFDGRKEELVHLNRITPVYPATEGVTSRFVRGLLHQVLPGAAVSETLPKSLEASLGLMPAKEAALKIHFPKSFEEKERARERLAFEEFFMIQTVLAIARRKRRVPRSFSYEIKRSLLTPFREKCGFEFTSAQKKVIREIFSDLQSPHPMNRLLQGDVGSGKTVVAVSAMLLAAENGLQSVLMAPTEILAEQHFITLKEFIKDLPVKVGLLTGSVQGTERKDFIRDCAEGKIQIAVGTHALLEKEIGFSKLGLVVIDEQHRFGVKHRLALTRRKPVPDVLVMTATPIPRTLALGLYGDLDISTIHELPPDRQRIETLSLKEAEALKLVRSEVEAGRQAYFVYPLIDETKSKRIAEEKEEGEILPALDLESLGILKLKAAVQDFEKLKTRAFKSVAMALIHGRMDRKEKEKVMLDFKAGKYKILAATTVIEVGIDVPNATVMVIQNADRFGLSTLHQLRGRVGRGKDASKCVLIAQPKTDQARKRMDIILRSQNGFEIAEEDLKLRGPGEIFGVSQHGIPPLKIADLNRDLPLLQKSHRAAQELIDRDPDLSGPGHAVLREHLRKHFSKTWFWGTIA